jgi:hypothetical protein
MKRVINAVVQIEYHMEDDDLFARHCTEHENDITALDLAIKANLNSIFLGVQLKSVQANIVNPDKLVDWNELKHNPDLVLIES